MPRGSGHRVAQGPGSEKEKGRRPTLLSVGAALRRGTLPDRAAWPPGGVGPNPLPVIARPGDVESVEVHHLGPRGHEVSDELRLRIRASVDLGQGPELGVRAEAEID